MKNYQLFEIFNRNCVLYTYMYLTVTGQWFSPGTPVSYTNKTDRHDITEILLNVALNTMKPNQTTYLTWGNPFPIIEFLFIANVYL